MRSSRLLFVERHDITVSSYPHPPVHNFRPYRHQPVDLEVPGRLAGDVSHDGGKTLSYNIAQFLQLFQPVQSLDAAHLVHTPPPTARISTNTLSRGPSATHTAIPVTSQNHRIHTLHNIVPPRLTSHPHANFCTAHLHKCARMVVAQQVPQPRPPNPVRRSHRQWVVQVLTISKLKRWSINYYIDTARSRRDREP